jgi:hypothetical protein
LPYLKASSKKIIETCRYCSEPYLYKYNGLWVISIKIWILHFGRPPHLYFFISHKKMVVIKFVQPWNLYQHTNYHGPLLTGARFTSTS